MHMPLFSFNTIQDLDRAWYLFFDQACLPCTLKDTFTHQYHRVSWPSAEMLGFSREHMKNHTLLELIKNHPGLNTPLNKQWSNQIRQLDQQVSIRKEPVSHKSMVFNDTKGCLHITHLTKSPVLNLKQQVIAIMSYAEVTTNTFDLLSLFQLYKACYVESKAIQYFLSYLHLTDMFHESPTHVEIKALLFSCSDTLYHNMLAYDTPHLEALQGHMTSLKDKLQDISIEELFSMIRAFYKQETIAL